MLTAAADVGLCTLLPRHVAAGSRGWHVLRTAFGTHLAAAFFIGCVEQLPGHKTCKPRRAKQGQQGCDSPQPDSQSHHQEV